MSGWRQATEAELPRLWAAARSARVATSLAEFQRYYADGPWRVRVSDAGDALVLRRWRAHLDVLALRAVWAPPHRIAWAVGEGRAVGADQGFGRLLSPLLARSVLGPYLLAGMCERETIVALQATPGTLVASLPVQPHLALRPAEPGDLDGLAELDAACFDDFWRHGTVELADVLARERVVVADDGTRVFGYASASMTGSTCTVGRLAVAAEARRHGVGGALLRDAASWAQREGALALSLCTQEHNAESRSLYRRAGLSEVSERYALAICGVTQDANVKE